MKTILTGLLLLLCSHAFAQSNLTNAEYFIDHDPGYGNGIAISISGDPAFINESIPNDLLPGIYTLYLRVQDDNNAWGMADAVAFIIREDYTAILNEPDSIAGMEFFIDEDPGVGKGTYISLLEGDTLSIQESLRVKNLSFGMHTIGIRLKSVSEIWGLREWTEFEVEGDACEDFSVVLNNLIDNLCAEDSQGSIDLTSSGGTGAYTYSWSNNDTLEDISGLPSDSYTVLVADNYYICSDTLEFTITEPPAIELTATVTDASGNNGAIDLTVTGGVGAYSFTWSNDAETEDLSDIPAGDYIVIVTDSNGCTITDTITVLSLNTGIEEGTNGVKFNLYPNPSNDLLNVRISLKDAAAGTLRIIDINGKVVWERKFKSCSVLEDQIDVSLFNSGVYAIWIETDKDRVAKRILITR
ncbi:MAG: T9SS type A sorting domain-containing protein [Bacteroidota bacterium]